MVMKKAIRDRFYSASGAGFYRIPQVFPFDDSIRSPGQSLGQSLGQFRLIFNAATSAKGASVKLSTSMAAISNNGDSQLACSMDD